MENFTCLLWRILETSKLYHMPYNAGRDSASTSQAKTINLTTDLLRPIKYSYVVTDGLYKEVTPSELLESILFLCFRVEGMASCYYNFSHIRYCAGAAMRALSLFTVSVRRDRFPVNMYVCNVYYMNRLDAVKF